MAARVKKPRLSSAVVLAHAVWPEPLPRLQLVGPIKPLGSLHMKRSILQYMYSFFSFWVPFPLSVVVCRGGT